MQGSSLSDSSVIALLNSKFIPLYADVDAYGFPEELKAIEKYKRIWNAFSKNKWGIATSAVVDRHKLLPRQVFELSSEGIEQRHKERLISTSSVARKKTVRRDGHPARNVVLRKRFPGGF
jgi:hypothetical protein